MKGTLSILLVFALCLGLCACQSSGSSTPATTTATAPAATTTVESPTTTTVVPPTTQPQHTHEWTEKVIAPTCTEGGYTLCTCACGESFQDDIVEVLGHAWDNGVVTVEPTEETEGERLHTCTACGETKAETVPVLNHTHSHEAAVTAPTCEAAGYTTYTCRCGDTYTADETAALGHAWVDATCTKAKACSGCGEKDGDALGHELEDGECIRCDETDPVYKALIAGRWAHYVLEGGELHYSYLSFKDGSISVISDYAVNISTLSTQLQEEIRQEQSGRLIEFAGETYVMPMASWICDGVFALNEDGSIKLHTENDGYYVDVLQWAGDDRLEVISGDGLLEPGMVFTFEEIVHKHIFIENPDGPGKVCVGCGETKEGESDAPAASVGLAYQVLNDGETCRIMGIGTCTDTDVVIGAYIDGYKVTRIDYEAFIDCTLLTSIVIPDTVTDIFAEAFRNCTNLTKVTIGSGLIMFGDDLFRGCVSLEEIIVSEENEAFCSVDGVVYDKARQTLIAYPPNKAGDSFAVPKGVTDIRHSAFRGSNHLVSITLPEGLTCINGNVFAECNQLESVSIPSTVTKIISRAFWRCESLVRLEFAGTMEQWNAINKDYSWNENTGVYIVYCTDGELSK